ncbi:LamG-like jellyroll fold domain-containing protein [Zeaxanthinibacter enoshimensis]|nr:LamG-like jellyroll fold domain-containing protein [Zeaxanthinibacter enoshimensis]
MRHLKYILSSVMALFLWLSCDTGIDPITKLEPGTDATAPQVTINYPTEGTKIKVLEAKTSVTIDFEVTDDIEVARIVVLMDGQQIASYSEFKDYRRVLVDDLVYDQVTDGSHELTVRATDLDGKETAATVNFEKEPAYTPLFAGEVLYMPFDGDYTDLISIAQAAKVGTPGFAGESVLGTNAFQSATDSYLTFPAEEFKGTEFSAAFWYKVSSSPDRAGILVAGDDADDRNQGFRLFREGGADSQTLKLNVGTGNGESWNDGGVLDVTAGEWVHVAFSIGPDMSTVYFNGQAVRSSAMASPIDWTGVNSITIGSGGETFGYWGHNSDSSPMDELRFFNKALTEAEVQNLISTTNPYTGEFEGEMFYLPFDGDNKELFSATEATAIGNPGNTTESVEGSGAYSGAADSYLTFPADELTTEEFSASFWYNVNADPDRAGILVMGPEDTGNAGYPDVQNLRTSGFRFFREGSADNQVFKLNVGNGSADSWFDGGAAASLDPATAGWVHMAFTISGSQVTVYFDGEIVSQGDFSGIDWTGVDLLAIGSGAPRFTEWGHLSDQSSLDELRLFSKALTQEEVQAIRNSDL